MFSISLIGREIQTRSRLKYQFSPVKLANIQEPDNLFSGRGRGGNRHSYAAGIQTGITSVEGNLPVSNTSMSTSTQKFHLGIYTEDTVPKIQKYIYTKLLIVALYATTKSGKLPTVYAQKNG